MRAQFMKEGLTQAMEKFKHHNKGNVPKQIIIYRDGVGGPSMMSKCEKHEVPLIIEAINDYSNNHTKVIYCFVDQKVNQRFFYKNNGDFINAGPGTVIDSEIVKNGNGNTSQYDFHMVPHKATVATAMPVTFSVKYTDSDMQKNAFETLTYHLCYNYFNFGGGIKVPNVVKYAEKAANYSVDIKGKPNANMSDLLHYL
jgi:hypothetical protein